MKKLILFLALVSAWPWFAASAADAEFRQVKLIVETEGRTLGAYQLVLQTDPKAAAVVGIEGGVPPQFAGLPAYDRRGLKSGKIRLAAFSLDDLGPKGKVCVARLHLALMKPDALQSLKITPEVVATPDGKKFPATATLVLVAQENDSVKPVNTEK